MKPSFARPRHRRAQGSGGTTIACGGPPPEIPSSEALMPGAEMRSLTTALVMVGESLPFPHDS